MKGKRIIIGLIIVFIVILISVSIINYHNPSHKNSINQNTTQQNITTNLNNSNNHNYKQLSYQSNKNFIPKCLEDVDLNPHCCNSYFTIVNMSDGFNIPYEPENNLNNSNYIDNNQSDNSSLI